MWTVAKRQGHLYWHFTRPLSYSFDIFFSDARLQFGRVVKPQISIGWIICICAGGKKYLMLKVFTRLQIYIFTICHLIVTALIWFWCVQGQRSCLYKSLNHQRYWMPWGSGAAVSMPSSLMTMDLSFWRNAADGCVKTPHVLHAFKHQHVYKHNQLWKWYLQKKKKKKNHALCTIIQDMNNLQETATLLVSSLMC